MSLLKAILPRKRIWVPAVVAVLLVVAFFVLVPPTEGDDGPPASPAAASVEIAYALTTIAGSGQSGRLDGAGMAASFNDPRALAIDASGRIYVAEQWNACLRRIDVDGQVVTLTALRDTDVAAEDSCEVRQALGTPVVAVSGNDIYFGRRSLWKSESEGPPRLVATFRSPIRALAVAVDGTVFVVSGNAILKVPPQGVAMLLAGSGLPGFADGPGREARFREPGGIALDRSGRLYVADTGNNRIRRVAPDGDVRTVAGEGPPGSRDGFGPVARFVAPTSLVLDAKGNAWIADRVDYAIRRLSPDGRVTTVVRRGAVYDPSAIAIGPDGSLVIAESSLSRIRRLTFPAP